MSGDGGVGFRAGASSSPALHHSAAGVRWPEPGCCTEKWGSPQRQDRCGKAKLRQAPPRSLTKVVDKVTKQKRVYYMTGVQLRRLRHARGETLPRVRRAELPWHPPSGGRRGGKRKMARTCLGDWHAGLTGPQGAVPPVSKLVTLHRGSP